MQEFEQKNKGDKEENKEINEVLVNENFDNSSVPNKNMSLVQSSLKTEKEEHEFGDLFVHQMIETIEFVLGRHFNYFTSLICCCSYYSSGERSFDFFSDIFL